jgi:hypothetical protein
MSGEKSENGMGFNARVFFGAEEQCMDWNFQIPSRG